MNHDQRDPAPFRTVHIDGKEYIDVTDRSSEFGIPFRTLFSDDVWKYWVLEGVFGTDFIEDENPTPDDRLANVLEVTKIHIDLKHAISEKTNIGIVLSLGEEELYGEFSRANDGALELAVVPAYSRQTIDRVVAEHRRFHER